MNDAGRRPRSYIARRAVLLAVGMTIVATLFCSSCLGAAPESEGTVPAVEKSPENMKYGLIGAAIAFGVGALAAGYAISHVGAAAIGAVAEKPQIAGQALIFVALAEGVVVFAFITALMILGKV